MNTICSVALSAALAALAIYKRAMTPAAVIMAFAFSVMICCFGGLSAFIVLALTFLLAMIADKICDGHTDVYKIRKPRVCRDAASVLCNVAVGTIAIVLCGATDNEMFSFGYAAAMAESLSDSLASKIGPKFGRNTIDICTLKPVNPGISGGISAAGCIASALGAMVPSALYAAFGLASLNIAAAIFAAGFAGSIFDSVLGSRLQHKLICPVCGLVVESHIHCGANTVYAKGFKLLDNNAVNLVSNLFSLLIFGLIYEVIL